MPGKSIEIYFNSESKTWCCLHLKDSTTQQMESMMGGYNILIDTVDEETKLYSGSFNSKDWFLSIFRMYGHRLNLIIE